MSFDLVQMESVVCNQSNYYQSRMTIITYVTNWVPDCELEVSHNKIMNLRWNGLRVISRSDYDHAQYLKLW